MSALPPDDELELLVLELSEAVPPVFVDSLAGSSFTIFPEGAIAYHSFSRPWPLIWPPFVSPANRYSAKPAYVTCVVPSGRLTVPSFEAVVPGPATGFLPAAIRTGGHCLAHAPLHLTTVPWSSA